MHPPAQHETKVRNNKQVTYVVMVSNIAITALAVGGHGGFLPWYYSIKFPTLITARLWIYSHKSWGWFLLVQFFFRVPPPFFLIGTVHTRVTKLSLGLLLLCQCGPYGIYMDMPQPIYIHFGICFIKWPFTRRRGGL